MQLRVLGPPELRDDGGALIRAVLAQPKRLALLAYLAVAEPRGVWRRDALLPLFWPERDEESARAALSRAVYHLRQSLGHDLIVSRTPEELELDATQLSCDLWSFEALRAEGHVADAFALWRGEPMAGLHVDGAPAFMRWLDALRDRTRTAVEAGALDLATRAAQAGDLDGVARWGLRALDIAPLDERAALLVMQALERQGDRAGALRTYEAMARRLAEDLEVRPSPELEEVAERLRRVGAPARAVLLEERPPQAAAAPVTPAPSPPPPHADRRRRPWLAGAAAMASALAVAGVLGWRTAFPDGGARLGPKVQITRSDSAFASAISPDGKQLAFLHRRCDTIACTRALLVQDVGSTTTRAIADSLGTIFGVTPLTWSPDRRALLYQGRIGSRWGSWLIPVNGGPPRFVGPRGAAFFADGDSLLIAPHYHDDSAYVFHVAAAGGAVSDSIVVRTPGRGVAALAAVPGTRFFVMAVRGANAQTWYVMDRQGRVADRVENACTCAGVASTDALWLSKDAGADGYALFRIPIDPSSGRIGTRQDTVLTGHFGAFSVTADGSRLVTDLGRGEVSVWRTTLDALLRGDLPDAARDERASLDVQWLVSPDGERVLVARAVADGTAMRWTLTTRAFVRGPEVPLNVPGATTSWSWADSVTVAISARGPGDTLAFSLVDVRDGRVHDRFVPGDTAVWAVAPIAGGWAWIPAGGKVVRVVRAAARRDWPVPSWFNAAVGIVGGTAVTRPFVVGYDQATNDSAGVAELDPERGRFTTWFHSKTEMAALQSLGEGRVLVRTSHGLPFLDYTVLSGPGARRPLGTPHHPLASASFSHDLSRVVAIASGYNGDAWMYHVRRR